jgi:hypothetical protein
MKSMTELGEDSAGHGIFTGGMNIPVQQGQHGMPEGLVD